MMYRSDPHPTPEVVGPTDWPPTLGDRRVDPPDPPEPRRFWGDRSVGDWVTIVVWLLLGAGFAIAVVWPNLTGPW